jgi:hypothetical protein
MTTTTNDGFVYLIVNDKAKEIFKHGIFELYGLYANGTESLIESEEHLSNIIADGCEIGIEIGFVSDILNQ